MAEIERSRRDVNLDAALAKHGLVHCVVETDNQFLANAQCWCAEVSRGTQHKF